MLVAQEGTSKQQLKVISIVGVGGLGKTTLANVMYQQLRGQFDCGAFISVSLKPDLKRILCSILRQVSEQGYTNTETWDVVELINKIRQVLEDKRYFIIVDDIWDESAWKRIKCALVENNCGSRIITTTRVAGVAESCCSDIDGTVYKLQPLSGDDSKKLFYKRIFGCEDGCHPELKEISEKILKKCDGVPLAIMAIGSLLVNKPRNINQWKNVHNSIGSGLGKCPGMENMRQILSMSYYGLPSHLKPCLLYLSVFPEDYSISIDQVARRWVAEGFVHGEHVTLYELGISYCNELINRSMVQPGHINADGRVETCRVHDMVLDLITSLSTEEHFITSLNGHQFTSLPRKIRRLCLQNSTEGHAIPQVMITTSFSHARSLIVFPRATNLMPPLSSFQVLRVLDLEGCRDLENHHINGVGNLVHLRYLGVRDTNITKLPKEIGNLHSLQTLDLRQTGITDLPSTIVLLRQLVRLCIETSVKLPDGFGNLESLQVLSSIGVSRSPNIPKELGNLTELRVLGIVLSGSWETSYQKSLLNSLCNLHKLLDLEIHSFGVSTEFIVDVSWVFPHLHRFIGSVSKLPNWINSSLSNLNTLYMWLNILRQEDLQTLGALPSLQTLVLHVLEIQTTEERLAIGTGHAKFLCLSKFWFHNNAIGLMFAHGAMPRLEILDILFRVRETKEVYGGFDLGLGNLSSLKQATVKIDCGGSRVCEVEDAAAAMSKAANLNPNDPRLDVIRLHEDDMIEDEGKLQVDEETTKDEEEEEIEFHRVGPWGGDGGKDCDITMAPRHLKSVKILSGNVVDALGFSYWDRRGKQHTTPLWGGVGGSAYTVDARWMHSDVGATGGSASLLY